MRLKVFHSWQAQHIDCAITSARNEGPITFSDNIMCEPAWTLWLVVLV